MAGKFVLTQSDDGSYHFSLKASNGQVILSSQQYSGKAAARTGIASVRTNAPWDQRYKRLTSSSDQPYFTLTTANEQVIGTSQMYASEAARETGIQSVKGHAPDAEIEDMTG